MRVVSGIQPTGNLHLGNYLGAIRNWVRMQDEMAEGQECLFFLADLHAISMPHDPVELKRATLEMTAALVACGIDAQKSVLFNQAQVPHHAELQWLLNGTARMGWLNRMTQFKDKVGKDREGASIGLFVYPVLQAADILLYNATHVPVGEDQKQHLELTRDIAAKFNHDYGVGHFPITEPLIEGVATRVMSLRDGSRKMSKSDPEGAVLLHDEPDELGRKLRKAYLDPEDSDSPVHELVEHILLPQLGSLTITPEPKYGEPSTWDDLAALRKALAAGEVHPLDYKLAVADALAGLLAPLAEHFAAAPDLLAAVSEITGD